MQNQSLFLATKLNLKSKYISYACASPNYKNVIWISHPQNLFNGYLLNPFVKQLALFFLSLYQFILWSINPYFLEAKFQVVLFNW